MNRVKTFSGIKQIAPTRYYSKTVELSFFQILRQFFKQGIWSWEKVEFEAVYKGDPRYEAAPFEESFVEIE
jgi:hypothetical protein